MELFKRSNSSKPCIGSKDSSHKMIIYKIGIEWTAKVFYILRMFFIIHLYLLRNVISLIFHKQLYRRIQCFYNNFRSNSTTTGTSTITEKSITENNHKKSALKQFIKAHFLGIFEFVIHGLVTINQNIPNSNKSEHS